MPMAKIRDRQIEEEEREGGRELAIDMIGNSPISKPCHPSYSS
jgi:hypothetical protein